MSAAIKTVFEGCHTDYFAPIAATLKALEQPLMRAKWAHGWKVPPQAYEPFSLAYVLGFFERFCDEANPLSTAGLRDARIAMLTKLLGLEAVARLDETLQLVGQHEINMLGAWQHGRKEADAQLSPDHSIACSWREYMYLEIDAYSFSYPRD